MAVSGSSQPYATPVGLIYVFNLIVGTGALALPRAFHDAGWLLASLILGISCFISYLNTTFVLESLSAANAVLMSEKMKRVKKLAVERSGGGRQSPNSLANSPSVTTNTSAAEVFSERGAGEREQLLQRYPSVSSITLATKAEYYEISRRTELAHIASLFLNKFGVFVVCMILSIYLFGDLAIYSAVVPKSLMNVICSNGSCSLNSTDVVPDTELCREGWPPGLTRMNVYRIMVCVFTIVIGPFVFVGMTKTKYLQIFTILSRWAAFILMITFAVKILSANEGRGHPPAFRVSGFAKLFGITVYAFMCQHSLPAVVTPMRRKSRIYVWFLVVYVMILTFYITLALTGSFAFAAVQDVYTLNFLNTCGEQTSSWFMYIVDYFLALFPVLTISMNFPIVGVTLTNNLRAMIFGQAHVDAQQQGSQRLLRSRSVPSISSDSGALNDNASVFETSSRSADDARRSPSIEERALLSSGSEGSSTSTIIQRRAGRLRTMLASKVALPATVLLIPVVVALWTDDVEFLASAVGAYAGAGVQFVIPSMLVLAARRRVNAQLTVPMPSKHVSPFRHWLWPVAVFVWAFATVVIVTINYILVAKRPSE